MVGAEPLSRTKASRPRRPRPLRGKQRGVAVQAAVEQ